MENSSELESEEAVIVAVTSIPQKAKKKGKPDYNLYTIVLDSGKSLATFDESLAEKAKAYKENADSALIEYHSEKYGLRLLSISDA